MLDSSRDAMLNNHYRNYKHNLANCQAVSLEKEKEESKQKLAKSNVSHSLDADILSLLSSNKQERPQQLIGIYDSGNRDSAQRQQTKQLIDSDFQQA